MLIHIACSATGVCVIIWERSISIETNANLNVQFDLVKTDFRLYRKQLFFLPWTWSKEDFNLSRTVFLYVHILF